MALQCGIVGLPNVGKSTLFNALSSAKAEAANFPFCTIEPNVGVVSVPDERLQVLEDLPPGSQSGLRAIGLRARLPTRSAFTQRLSLLDDVYRVSGSPEHARTENERMTAADETAIEITHMQLDATALMSLIRRHISEGAAARRAAQA